MADSIPFAELETDDDAIRTFVERENARTEDKLCDTVFHEDMATALEILRDDSFLAGLRRRGPWIYNYLRNADHPKGLWRRLPETAKLSPDADWEPVFDLDAFCEETGEDWHWRGAETAHFDGEKLLLALSCQGQNRPPQRISGRDPIPTNVFGL
ncbi:MAG: hypothetical protein AAFV38_12305, partial [Pseudomonadota bacterium]